MVGKRSPVSGTPFGPRDGDGDRTADAQTWWEAASGWIGETDQKTVLRGWGVVGLVFLAGLLLGGPWSDKEHLPPRWPRQAININQASADELSTLPGIGPVLAGRIVDHRRREGDFRSIAELKEVDGIGLKKLEQVTPWIRAERHEGWQP